MVKGKNSYQGCGGNKMFKRFKTFINTGHNLKIFGTLLLMMLVLTIALHDLPIDRSWSSWSLPLSGQIFVIDPGHGGPDGGAKGSDGTDEKEITLKISEYLRDYLNEAGALVIMTRETDTDLAQEGTKGLSKRKFEDLKNRVKLANESMADFYISIHLNSTPSSRWRGAQTFYYPFKEENEIMAKSIQNQLTSNLQNTNRTSLPRTDILVLKYVNMPSTMVEVGFLSNPEEAQLLKDEEYQRKVAFAIYQGMLDYYSENDNQELKDSQNSH